MKKWKCKVCGYIHEGDSAPECCPLCKQPASAFEMIEQAPVKSANKYAGTQTEKNLEAAFAGESQARNKYTYFSSVAQQEGYEQIAALLSERGWSTTFFVGGKWVEKNGDTVLKLAADGFEIGNHGYLHRDHASLSADNNRAEILITERLLAATLSGLGDEEIAAALPRLFAPPSGSMGKAMFEACDELGYTVVMWTRDTIDWRDHDAALITQRATKNLAGGDLILMHPTAATVEALPAILDAIAAAGLAVAPVSETIGAAG